MTANRHELTWSRSPLSLACCSVSLVVTPSSSPPWPSCREDEREGGFPALFAGDLGSWPKT
eukprot:870753-Prorocentrum_minimum.AAC.1